MEGVTLHADFEPFNRKLAWISKLLSSPDVFERIDSSLFSRLQNAAAGVGDEKIARIGSIPTHTANKLVFSVEGGLIFTELESALGTLGFEFH